MSKQKSGGELVLSQREMNELAQFSISGHSSQHLIARQKLVKSVMKEVMQENVHYGKVPGTDKPTLLKAGSEVLLSTFAIAVKPEVEVVPESNGGFTYRVKAVGEHIATGKIVGVGVGEASTSEEKYAWRRAVSDAEFDYFEKKNADSVRIKFGFDKQKGREYQIKQVRTNPADQGNTVLKMAKKRAQSDMTLTALSVSDMFTQDVEDLPPEYVDDQFAGRQQQQSNYSVKQRSTAPQQASQQQSSDSSLATEKQIALIRRRLSDSGVNEAEFCLHFKIDTIESLPKAVVNDALAWAQGG